MALTSALVLTLTEIEETLDIYYDSFYEHFPEEEDLPNEIRHPGSSETMTILNKIYSNLFGARRAIKQCKNPLPYHLHEAITKASNVLDPASDELYEEWEKGIESWSRNPQDQLRNHFERMIFLLQAILEAIVKLKEHL